jgi:hypothetical protein
MMAQTPTPTHARVNPITVCVNQAQLALVVAKHTTIWLDDAVSRSELCNDRLLNPMLHEQWGSMPM